MSLFRQLFEQLTATYVVKKVEPGTWHVTKFAGKKEPEAQRTVEIRKGNRFWTDSPGFIHKGQEERNIRIVKQFLDDGEPELMSYMVDEDTGKITSKKFG